MKMRNVILIISWCFLFAQCTPDPSFHIQPYEPKLVIDGSIEQNDFPRVTLSYSDSYFVDIDSTSIRQLLATTAKVTVSDGVQDEVLTLKRNNNFFPPYVYQGTSLKGQVGKIYKLKVEIKGETYTAQTTIPPPVKFDKL